MMNMLFIGGKRGQALADAPQNRQNGIGNRQPQRDDRNQQHDGGGAFLRALQRNRRDDEADE